jgi:serine/threonine protein phosphatase PrpC
MSSLRVTGAARTDKGCVRELNEDSFCERPDIGLWAVADGMGGHEHGERASGAIVAALGVAPAESGFEDQIGSVANAIHSANKLIYDESVVSGGQMGSTVVALLVADGRFAVAWAGDSPAFLLRGGQLHRLSVDHTQVQEMLDRGLLTAQEARTHPLSHVLARAVGVRDTLELDVVVDQTQAGDMFLLSSDGLTGVVEDAEIAALMRPGDPHGTTAALVALCLERGAPDNVTVCAVEVSQATILALAERSDG